MWTSWRSSFLGVIAIVCCQAVWAAGPITFIDITRTGSSSGPFDVGVDTNSGSGLGNIYVTVTASGGAAPDPGQVINIDLLQGTSLLSGGVSPTTIVTTTDTVYGGGSVSRFPLTFFRSGSSLTLRATVAANAALTDATPSFTVNPGAAAKLIVIPPGTAHDPGKDPNVAGNIGRSGSATLQQPGQTFAVTVIETDNWFNTVSGAPVVTMTSDDLVTFSPVSAALSAGQRDFSVTINIAKSLRTLTASGPGLASGAADVRTEGPEKEQVFPYPSPFNPQTGSSMNFRFQLNDSSSVALIVKDRFGQNVWKSEFTGARGPNEVVWDGRNEEGNIVAAGVYYALLEVGGDIKSKKAFGVTK
jgi:hypothetical protein